MTVSKPRMAIVCSTILAGVLLCGHVINRRASLVTRPTRELLSSQTPTETIFPLENKEPLESDEDEPPEQSQTLTNEGEAITTESSLPPEAQDVDWISDFRKRGYVFNILPNKTKLWTRDVHLCVMFNLNNMKPDEQAMNLLLAYYLPFFNHITILFDGVWEDKPNFLPDYVNFIGCESYLGWYQHRCVKSCLTQAPSKDTASLYIADDMFINLSKMANLPPSNLWYIRRNSANFTAMLQRDKQQIHNKWIWFGPPHYNEMKLKAVIDGLPQEWKKRLVENAGYPDNYLLGANFDIIYVPSAIASELEAILTHIIHQANLFCEVAGPLSVGILRPKTEVIEMNKGFLWAKGRTLSNMRALASTAHFIHPVKLRKKEHADLWRGLMESQLHMALEL